MPKNTAQITISLPKTIVETIRELANEEKRSASNMAAILLTEALEQRPENE